MQFLTDFADQAVVLPLGLAVAVVLAQQGWRGGALIWLAVLCTTLAMVLVLKLVFLGCAPIFAPLHLRSPSGHVAAATVVSGGLTALLVPRRCSVLAVGGMVAAAIGGSRLALGLHSVPEVALGAAIGLAGALMLARYAPPVPRLLAGRLLTVAVAVLGLFHGVHLPAEAAIRHMAFRASWLPWECRPEWQALPPAP